MTKGFSEFHYYGFLTKCAEYGLTDAKVVDAMYKAAVPIRKVRNAYTGEGMGYENFQARPDLQAAGYVAAQKAVPGGGPPHIYQPLKPGATPQPQATASRPAAPAPKPAPVQPVQNTAPARKPVKGSR